MDKKLRETTNLGSEIVSVTSEEKTWSRLFTFVYTDR